ncbi:pilus assembly protein PilW [Aliivibrio finisterrensis]|uniref:PilW family protein n=1 Tax=Aliivibrio finisterrensis TaxID=511998 RepID=UPI0010223625|nr:pilus assembly protein PilW [Aliivibrio finisterrensis]RYU64773.1 pilus assembly protein PilW [Aliivibrio finisterrensis]RYU68133.1 pilus assembly protein PilW [Aliivibrio finisterrensis]RYU71621.1 pilus assembly protein PilW [Aliivibrio finisterrensis]
MAITPVHKYKQQGASLIELLIASFIGVIAISLVGSIFINGQRVAKERGLELLLIQNLTSTVQIIKEDIQRAGYDGSDGQSIKLSGAVNVIEITSDSVGFAYHRKMSGAQKTYQNIVYKYSPVDKKLKICEEKTLINNRKEISEIGDCNSLFDSKNIHVTAFSIVSTPLVTSAAMSSIIDIRLDANLMNIPTMTKSLSFSAKQRNWQ